MMGHLIERYGKPEPGSVWLCFCTKDEPHAVIMTTYGEGWVEEPDHVHWSLCSDVAVAVEGGITHPDPDRAYADLIAARLMGNAENE